jgi:hypothetical protein
LEEEACRNEADRIRKKAGSEADRKRKHAGVKLTGRGHV